MNLRRQKLLDRGIGIPLLAILKPLVILAGIILKRDHTLPDPGLDRGGRITVLKMLGGGSLVIALPALLGLRKRFPRVHFQLVTTPSVAPFARTLGVFDEILTIEQNSVFALAASALHALVKCFRSNCFIDLEVYSKLSTVFSVFTCAHNRIGFYLENVIWRKPIHTHLIFFNRFAPVHLFYERVAILLGAEVATYQECQKLLRSVCKIPEVSASPQHGRPVVVIGSGCSALGQERMFTAPEWSQIFRSQLEKNPALSDSRIVFLGGPEDQTLADSILKILYASHPNLEIENLCGKLALTDSIRVLAEAREFWGIDSSLLHYARLLGRKCISFWGPTAPFSRLKKFPIEEEVHYRKVPCSPCVHVTEFPPCNGNNVCMKSLVSPMTDDILEKNLPVFHGAPEF